MNKSATTELHHFSRPEGRLSYTVEGSGPLVVAVPGMGVLRSSYREVAAALVEAGYRVAVCDIRGHGDSDTGFHEYGDVATAGDIVAMIDELDGPALVIGNSFAGSAAIIAAADRPDAVAGLALISPFVREGGSRAALAFNRMLYRVLFARPWGAGVWTGYFAKTLNKGATASWLPEQLAELRTSFADPRRLAALRHLTLQLDHSVVEPYLSRVVAPALIAVGAIDPDYRDPAAELAYMGGQLHAETLLVEDAAHYVHAQRPDVVLPRIVAFAAGLRDGAGWRAPRA